MLAIGTLLVVVLMSLLVTRVSSVALVMTGLSPDVASFQARSALSGTGFATAESEQITGHPARRQIIQTLMLFGNAGLVTTVASLSLSFASVDGPGGALSRLALLIVGLLGVLLLARNKRAAALISRVSERLLRRYTSLDVNDYAGLLHIANDFAVNRIRVAEGQWLAGKTLADARLSDEGALVLGVERADGIYLGAPRGDLPVEAGDTLLVYGADACLAELHHRPAGAAGQAAHEANVAAARQRDAQELSMDSHRRRRRRRR